MLCCWPFRLLLTRRRRVRSLLPRQSRRRKLKPKQRPRQLLRKLPKPSRRRRLRPRLSHLLRALLRQRSKHRGSATPYKLLFHIRSQSVNCTVCHQNLKHCVCLLFSKQDGHMHVLSNKCPRVSYLGDRQLSICGVQAAEGAKEAREWISNWREGKTKGTN